MSSLPRWWSVPLLLVLVWGLALRVWLAAPDLTERRFWDERYQVDNLRALLKDGQLHPVRGFYPGLSYLPHAVPLAGMEALYRLTGRRAFAVFDEAGAMTPAGYFVCRFLQALAGALSLYLTFRIGRRLFSPGVGLLGALLLAAVPWHLRQSVVFKPDILVTAACLLAFELSLAAAERPARRSYLQAGSAIGLALASKLNAGPIAVPLMVAALTGGGWRDWRSWSRLVWAGVASIAVFLLLTPFFALDSDFYLQQSSNILRSYEQKATNKDSSHLWTLWAGLRAPLLDGYHGRLLGALALLGLGMWLVRALRLRGPETSRMERLGPAMAASFVLSFILLYSLATKYPVEHNFLPLAPFTSLAAAWVLFRIWEELRARLRWMRHRASGALAAGAFSLVLAVPATLYTYRSIVPTTHELARARLFERIRPHAGLTFIFERGVAPALSRPGRTKMLLQPVERLDSVAPLRLDRADAELFLAARLDQERRPFYQSRLATGDGRETVRVPPSLFRARGPELLLVLHPWNLVGKPVPLRLSPQADRRHCVGRLPAGGPGDVGSLEVALLPGWEVQMLQQILVDGQPVAWDVVGREGRRRLYVTQRFPVADPSASITVALGRTLPHGAQIKVIFRRWHR